MMRGFETVKKRFLESHYNTKEVFIPERSTQNSAGYDFVIPKLTPLNHDISIEEIEMYSRRFDDDLGNYVIIEPNSTVVLHTDVKTYMLPDEYLNIHIRSSIAIKYNLRIKNIVGIIDSDYYSNPENDGNIIIGLYNFGNERVFLPKFDKNGNRMKIAQGIFGKYLLADGDIGCSNVRTGGVGSTTGSSKGGNK